MILERMILAFLMEGKRKNQAKTDNIILFCYNGFRNENTKNRTACNMLYLIRFLFRAWIKYDF